MAKLYEEEAEKELDEQEQRDEMFKKYTEAIVSSSPKEKKSYQAVPNLNVSLSKPEINISDINDINMNKKGITNDMSTSKITVSEEDEKKITIRDAKNKGDRDVMKLDLGDSSKKTSKAKVDISDDYEDEEEAVDISKAKSKSTSQSKNVVIKKESSDLTFFGLSKSDTIAAFVIVICVIILIFLIPATMNALKNL